jgi:hypothetical protein
MHISLHDTPARTQPCFQVELDVLTGDMQVRLGLCTAHMHTLPPTTSTTRTSCRARVELGGMSMLCACDAHSIELG